MIITHAEIPIMLVLLNQGTENHTDEHRLAPTFIETQKALTSILGFKMK